MMKVSRKALFLISCIFPLGLLSSCSLFAGKSASYSRAKEVMDPDLYLVYRLTDRILTANSIKRPVRVAVRRGVAC